jgi:Txe/YoeB family toxin of Txe-Axe toxin-antitoxin module
MEIIYSPRAVEDLKYWKKSGDKITQKKIEKLLDAIVEDPYNGIGKPEPLKYIYLEPGHVGLIKNTVWFMKLMRTTKL